MNALRYLAWILRALLFALLFLFAVKNIDPVTVRFYLDYEWQAPLVLALLTFFAAGAAAGVLACLGSLFRQRREIAGLKREADAKRAAVPGESPAGPPVP